jgi:hypothetical protein
VVVAACAGEASEVSTDTKRAMAVTTEAVPADRRLSRPVCACSDMRSSPFAGCAVEPSDGCATAGRGSVRGSVRRVSGATPEVDRVVTDP